MSNETVTYSLESVLTRIESKIDSLEKRMDEKIDSLEKRMDERFDKVDERFDKVEDRLTKLEIGQADLKGDIKVLDEKVEGLTVRVAYQENCPLETVTALRIIINGYQKPENL